MRPWCWEVLGTKARIQGQQTVEEPEQNPHYRVALVNDFMKLLSLEYKSQREVSMNCAGLLPHRIHFLPKMSGVSWLLPLIRQKQGWILSRAPTLTVPCSLRSAEPLAYRPSLCSRGDLRKWKLLDMSYFF